MESWLAKHAAAAPFGILTMMAALWTANGGEGGLEGFAGFTEMGIVVYVAFLAVLDCIASQFTESYATEDGNMFYAIAQRNKRIRARREAARALLQTELGPGGIPVASLLAALPEDTAKVVWETLRRMEPEADEQPLC